MLSRALLDNREHVRKLLSGQPYAVFDDALESEFAENLRAELLEFDGWEYQDQGTLPDQAQQHRQALAPDYSFQRKILLFGSVSLPPLLEQLYEYLSSETLLEWAAYVCNRSCHDFEGAAAMMEGGGHIADHNDYAIVTLPDGSTVTRALTFNYYLTRDWRPEWGGGFVWKSPPARILPAFNRLVMFRVGQGSTHLVEPVASCAAEKRLAVTGWFRTIRKPVDINIPGL